MTPAPPKPRKSKAAAAKAETNGGGPKTAEWRGLVIPLPDALPGEVMWDIAEIQGATDTTQFAPILKFITTIVGDEQVAQIRARMREENIPMEEVAEVIKDLLGGIFAAYGMTAGESPASAGS